MASKTSQDKMNEWLHKVKQQPNYDKGPQNNRPHRPRQPRRPVMRQRSITQPSPNDTPEVAKLKREVKRAKDVAANAEKSRDQVVNAQQAEKEDTGIHHVVHGFDERFDKTYHPHYIGSDGKEHTYSLHVILKPLTAADQYEVYAQEEELTHNMGRFFEANEHVVLQAFTTMRVAGIEVPESFKDPKKLYRMQLLVRVYFDYLDWERRFCSHRKE